jgi:hypothetical protein
MESMQLAGWAANGAEPSVNASRLSAALMGQHPHAQPLSHDDLTCCAQYRRPGLRETDDMLLKCDV